MALKKARHKLQSSIANFHFATIDLPLIWSKLDWQIYKKIPGCSIVRNEKDHTERLTAIQLSVLANHIEIMKQCLYEQIELLGCKDLSELKYFLLDLRNAFGHTVGELIPRYSEEKLHTNKQYNKNTFEVDIPIKEIGDNIHHDPSSNFSMKFIWRGIKPNKKINVTSPFMHKILILSHHLLEIVKKQKRLTLDSYLKKIPKATANCKY